MSFHVGQKVVCVDDADFLNPHLRYLTDGRLPAKGSIYTVRGISKGETLLLVEIISKPHLWVTGFHEGGWLPRRFRPLVERKTDISVFTEMLKRWEVPA